MVRPKQVRFDFPLPRTARLLASGKPIKIVALGSLSTTRRCKLVGRCLSQPSRRGALQSFPGPSITVLNRGVNGEEIDDMLARLDEAVIAEHPDCFGRLAPIGVARQGAAAARR